MCNFASKRPKAVPEMTYTVLGGMLNPTHSLRMLSIEGQGAFTQHLIKKNWQTEQYYSTRENDSNKESPANANGNVQQRCTVVC